jgi:zinc transporter ZupT
MFETLTQSSPILQAFVATLGTYLLTALGTLPVLFVRSAPRQLMDAMMGFAGGVMVAASCWSLLVPAIERGGVGGCGLRPAAGRCVPLRRRSGAAASSWRVPRRGSIGRARAGVAPIGTAHDRDDAAQLP